MRWPRIALVGSGALLGLRISSPAGVADPDVTESFGSTTTVNNDSRRRVWRIRVPAAGAYTITTEGQVNGYINPRLEFGHDSSLGFLVWGFVALFVVALLGLGAAIWGSAQPEPGRTVSYNPPARTSGSSNSDTWRQCATAVR